MLFRSHVRDLDFELGGKRYVVPHGSDVEIPDRLAYCVSLRGILLVASDGGGNVAVAVKSPPSRPPAPSPLPRVSVAEAVEELADVTGEDMADDDSGEAEESDMDAARRTAEMLERQGIALPGRRPRRKG